MSIDIALERELKFRLAGDQCNGKVTIGKIFFQPEKNSWACEWSLSHLHHGTSLIYGKDPMDALINTLDFLSNFIRGSEEDGYSIWCQNEGDHGGLNFTILEKAIAKKLGKKE